MRTNLCGLFCLAMVGCGGTNGGDLPSAPVSADLTGINVNPRFRDPSVSGSNAGYATPGDLNKIGIARTRFEFQTNDAEDLSEAFAYYDPIIDDYLMHGIGVLLILDHATVKTHGTADDLVAAGGWNDYVARFSSATDSIVGHYQGRVDAFEIWNEENGSGDGFMHVPPAAFSQLLLAAATAINGRATVVAGGLFWKDVDFGDPNQPAYLASLPDGIVADVIATHPYFSWPGSADEMPDEVRNDPMGWDTMDDHLATLGGYGMPIWITEWGTPSQTLLPQLIRAFYTHLPAVDRSYFFAWSDAMKAGHGLTYSDGHTPKPELQELQQELANEQAAQASVTLHAVVVDADSGAPLAPPYYATVYAGRLDGVRAADDGSFSVSDVKRGSYQLVIVGGGGDGAYGATSAVMATDASTAAVALPRDRLDGGAARGSVSGTVYDSRTSRPVAGDGRIVVACGGKMARVGADGRYRIDGVASGTLHIATADLSERRVYHDNIWTVAVTGGQTASYDVTLSP